jgi:hypothetical protein
MLQMLQTQIACGQRALEKRGAVLPADHRGPTHVTEQYPTDAQQLSPLVWKPAMLKTLRKKKDGRICCHSKVFLSQRH